MVLLLEDNEPVRTSIIAMLSELGQSCCARGNASDLDDLGAVQAPVLLIVDRLLGAGDGIALANQLLLIHRGLPVIVISGSDHSGCIEQLEGAGGSLFLLKPFGMAELQAAISSLLGTG